MSASAPTYELARLPLFDALERAENVLIAGAGGGFDVYCGIPLFVALTARGKRVHLANLTFTNLDHGSGDRLSPGLVRVDHSALSPIGYFPEKLLSEWLLGEGHDVPIYTLEKLGVAQAAEAYDYLARELALDAVVLVDGGTDSLMRGDESGLGTPAEDAISLAAVDRLDVATKLLVCLGFGVDSFHGVCHAHFLEAVAALSRAGGYLGSFSLVPGMAEADAYARAVRYAHAQTAQRESIVNASIVSALEGEYGNHHATQRTRGSELWINPLMSIYWAFDLAAVAARSLYLELLADTTSIWEVVTIIEGFRKTLALARQIRDREPIPV